MASAPSRTGRKAKGEAGGTPAPLGMEVSPAEGVAPAVSGGVEALLLSVDRPLSSQKIAAALTEAVGDGEVTAAAVEAAVGGLNGEYERTGRSFRIERVAGGFRVMTLPAFAGVIGAYQGSRAQTGLSRAALETLAIVAYKQPVTRARLEAIRGVSTGEVLKTLLDRKLVAITGRAEELGRPLLYGTTARFLEVFGLSSLRDLPTAEELKGGAGE